MWFFKRSKENRELEQQSAQEQKEKDEIKLEQFKFARKTVHQYAEELRFPADAIDVRFYNHLFSILVDQNRRITELEKQILKKDS